MDLKIKGKIAIVTGSGKGIGRACALQLAREGANVVISDIDDEAGAKTCEDIEALGVGALYVHCNVSDEADVKKLFKAAYSKFGRIDILINNAGISPKLPFYEITEEQFRNVLDINLKSNFMCSKEAFEYMKDNGWGRIVSLSSLAGLHGGINSASTLFGFESWDNRSY